MSMYKGSNYENIKDMNRTILIRLIKKLKTCTRAELAKRTGLTPAAITKIVNKFLEWGLVVEVGHVVGEKGRRSIGIQFNGDNYYFIGVRITRKNVLIGLFDITGNIIVEKNFTMNVDDGPHKALSTIRNKIDELLDENADKSILSIGIAVPGPYFPKEGIIDKLSGVSDWENVSLDEELRYAFRIPTVIEHDANAGALAEWWLGDNDLHGEMMVYLAVGQGIGAGIIDEGELFTGGFGTAGEIGHTSINVDGDKCICGNTGCLEMYASTTALFRDIKKSYTFGEDAILEENFSLEDIVFAMNNGDEVVNSSIDKIAKYLGVGIVNSICVYSPDLIVIGDEISILGSGFVDKVRRVVNENTIRRFAENVRIQHSSFDKDSAFIGSAATAIDYALNNPKLFKK